MTGGEKSYLQNVSRKCNFQQSEKLDFQNFPKFLYPTWNPLKIWPGSAPDSCMNKIFGEGVKGL